MRQAGRLQEIYEKHKGRADFYFVYIREAHPSDGWRPARHIEIEQPKSFERRVEVAGQCCSSLDVTIPVLVDDMKDSAARAYNAMPDRLFVVTADGKIAYRGTRGPRGFKVDEMAEALKKILDGEKKKT